MTQTTTLSREEVFEQLAAVCEEMLEIPASDLTDDSHWIDDLDADSLDLVDVALSAKQKFGVQIPKEDLADLVTVGKVVDYIVANQPT